MSSNNKNIVTREQVIRPSPQYVVQRAPQYVVPRAPVVQRAPQYVVQRNRQVMTGNVEPRYVNVEHNGETHTIRQPPVKSNGETIKIVIYLVFAGLVGVLIYYLWKEFSSFWLFQDIGDVLGLANKAGKGTSNFFKGLF